jgi:hypothetical protein
VITKQNPKLGFANTYSVLKHSVEHRFQFTGRTGNDLQHLGGCSLLFQCLSEVLLGLGEFAGSLVELLLEVDSGEIAISRDRWRFSALELRCRTAAFLHCCAALRCVSLTSSHATAPPFVNLGGGQPLLSKR